MNVAERYLLVFALSWSSAAVGICDLETTGIRFDDYGPLNAAHMDSQGQVSVSCSGTAGETVSYVLRLSSGSTGSFSPRAMSGPQGHTLSYNLFKNPARSEVWGDGNSGSAVVVDGFQFPGGGGPLTHNHAVFARLFARQPVPPGPYQDSVLVTLEICEPGGQCEVAAAAVLSVQ